jgi:hypothetical protein
MTSFSGLRSRTCAALAAGLAAALLAPSAASAQTPTPAPQQPQFDGFTMTAFDPQKHSFRFANAWNGSLSITLPIVGRVNLASFEFGLCGGMSAAALDSFRTKLLVPTDVTSAPNSGPLRKYVFDRQVDSLKASGAYALRTFLDWQARPLESKKVAGITIRKGTIPLTIAEFNSKIRVRLRDGHPVPIGLVNVSGLSAPWRNHQVLAIGYRNRPGNHVTVAIYDPNYAISNRNPDGIAFLHTQNRKLTLTPDPNAAQAPGSPRFRGFFRIPYSQKTPPKPPWSEEPPPQPEPTVPVRVPVGQLTPVALQR